MTTYLIIVPNDLSEVVSALVQQKIDRGYKVIVKPVEEFGTPPNPEEMRRYVLALAPQFLLLVGDYDRTPGYRLTRVWHDGGQLKHYDYLSDAYFSMDMEDLCPTIPTGRLSSNEPAELQTICDKLVNYPADSDLAWKANVILCGWIPRGLDCTDMTNCRDDAGWACLDEIGDYYRVIKRFENHIDIAEDGSLGNGPQRRETWEVDGTDKQSLIDAIEEGALIVRYLGHGDKVSWSNIGLRRSENGEVSAKDERLHAEEDVLGLDVGDKLPLVISAACYTGNVEQNTSFAETWQRFGKAVGIFASDHESSTVWNDRISQLIFNEIVSKHKRTVGHILTDAMQRLVVQMREARCLGELDKHTFRMFRYLGDPDTILAHVPHDIQATVNISRVRVLNVGLGTKADMRLKFVVNGQSQYWPSANDTRTVSEERVYPINRQFRIGLSESQPLIIMITGIDADRIGADDPMGMIQLHLTPEENWGEGQNQTAISNTGQFQIHYDIEVSQHLQI